MSYKEIGIKGEVFAKNYLIKNKYKIIETNYICPLGEIDIISKDRDVLVFIEVKTRTTDNFGLPQEAVNFKKQQKIKQVATYYLVSKNLYNKVQVRFDVVSVLNDNITLIKNAFD